MKNNRPLAALLCACLTYGPAAQAAQKNRSTLQSGYTSNLPDNTTGAITPAILRSTLADNTDSNFNLLTDTLASIAPTGTNGQIFFNSAGLIAGKPLSGLMDSIGSVRGSTLYRGAAAWATAAPGATGTVWTSNGAGADPTWQTITGGGGGGVTGGGTSIDKTLPRFNGTTGAALKSSNIVVSDNDEISGFRALIVPETTTARTLAATDRGTTIRCTNTAAVTFTLPNNLIAGFTVEVLQGSTGQVTFTPASGATVNNAHGQTKTYGQYAAIRLVVVNNADGVSAVYNLAGDTGS